MRYIAAQQAHTPSGVVRDPWAALCTSRSRGIQSILLVRAYGGP